jgi:hypothetical protein
LFPNQIAEELALSLTLTFADKCFTPLELHCFKQTFKALAEEQPDLKFWSEPTLIKFLELPESLEAGPVLYQLCSYLGAFPFPSHAPAILTGEALLRIVCWMTGRYMKVLRGGEENWRAEIWRSFAVPDSNTTEAAPEAAKRLEPPQETSEEALPAESSEQEQTETTPTDKSKDDKEHGEYDELAYHTFELLNALESFKEIEQVDVEHAKVPAKTFLKLLELLLLIAPLAPQENISFYTANLDGERRNGLRAAASSILASFGADQTKGISYESFNTVVSHTLPHLFDSLDPLFEHFLFPPNFDLNKPKDSEAKESEAEEPPNTEPAKAVHAVNIPDPEPLLPVHGDILDLNLLSQLSFVFSDKSIFHRLKPLYLGHNHGYSMGSFEKSVFKWQAPSILLVSGTLISPNTRQSHAKAFIDDLPHRRLSSSVSSLPNMSALEISDDAVDNERIVYGAYIPVPWESTTKTTFGNDKTTLFQLSPVHDVFPASSSSTNYIYFNKNPATYPGMGFGSPMPTYSSMTTSQSSIIGGGGLNRRESVTSYSATDTAWGSGSFSGSAISSPTNTSAGSPGMMRRSSLLLPDGGGHLPLGPVSLHIDDALQFGVFTHVAAGGGSFVPSTLPDEARPGARRLPNTGGGGGSSWQDRFEIDAIEVWGVGDANTVEEQRRAWLWEETEAERRRRVNLSTGDKEADKELLRMAGLIKDEARSGGSMG